MQVRGQKKQRSESEQKAARLVMYALASVLALVALGAFLAAQSGPASAGGDGGEPEAQSSASSAAAEAAPPMTEHQASLIESYGPEQREVVSLLSSNVWTDYAGESRLAFDEAGYTITPASGTASTHAYAVAAAEKRSVPADGETINQYDCSVEVDGEPYLMTIQQSQADPSAMTLSSKAFGASVYVRATASGGFQVADLPDDAVALLGGSREAVERAVEEHCSTNFPSATCATCTQAVTIDCIEGTSECEFVLDNQARSHVRVVFSKVDGTIAVPSV